MRIRLPSSFLWGAALSSYQCEGENSNSDWYAWEKEKNLQQSGRACDHYRLFDRDFKEARNLNLNSLRFSIEWARVNPSPGVFSDSELEHYRLVVDALLKRGLHPLITLHHFTNPLWFNQTQGWLNPKNIDYFLAYLKKIVDLFRGKIDLWVVFNEPLVYIYNSFIRGIWPPGEKSFKSAKKALDNIIIAYLLGYQEIKKANKKDFINSQVSFSKHVRIFSGCPDFNLFLNSLSAFCRNQQFNFWLIDKLQKKKSLDFIALNYYCKEYVSFKGLLGTECKHKIHKERRNQLGWDIYPEGLFEVLLDLKRFELPIIITENGTAESEDNFYQEYLLKHLKSVGKAFLSGVDIKGYFWWSLLDNFEWEKGFKHRFGLLAVDFETMDRKVRPFAKVYAEICKSNEIEI